MNINVNRVKIITMASSENVEEVRTAICEVGAGIIGNYSYCSTSTRRIGTFKPNDKASSYIGENDNFKNIATLLNNLPLINKEFN